ncbi:MAG: CDP-diacylglycerol--glycerol-3-phosphate 3-phosphatidyltransferase [Methylococcales bacterium]|nr:CDP-diacylglycerol--glycerol-3-phosphate 3-phosphatidyltransferase [Methylococcales bacterium]
MAFKFTIPTYLTLLRIAFIPLLVIVFYLPWQSVNLACTGIFILASITDWLDGYLARKMQQETAFGAFLDPVADKLMVAIVLVLLVESAHSLYLTIPAAIIIGREITIASLREWMAEIGKSATVKVSSLGKWKTTTQMLSITLLLYGEDFLGLPIVIGGYCLLYVAAILTLWSMMQYLIVAIPALKN